MPEMHFRVRWPDQSTSLCYSPSLVIKDFLKPGETYELNDFVSRSRTALDIASERVRQKYGYTCSSAMSQLAEIETIAARFSNAENPKVWVDEFIE
ncbi:MULTISPECIES: MSMEG_0570 family nitrogen starvation response protein [Methylobacter]|uniref:MSMEG_0570 family nitrogen starvation response protein n=1 Tax=Methylobacter TaxID=429 RepID=UPI001FACBCF0|nr:MULTISPECIES: MSMEG_0570 family nitrogen starvation response protein [Methylobacter]UOA07122.1 MSMEG_0570 family nitrogen starvation response protein [Methylobacter sp. S3L5C]